MIEIILQLPIGFMVALSGALIPGPMFAFVVSKTASSGAKAGFLAAVGHILVEFCLLVLIALGLGVALSGQSFQSAVFAVGGVSLVLISILTLSKLKTVGQQSKAPADYRPLVGGVLFSTVFNPTVFLWWATVGTVMLAEAWVAASAAGVVAWLTGHFLADISWFSFVSYSVHKGKRFMGERGHRALLAACGLILFAFGVLFISRVLLQLF
ncbi:MAG: LysE family transporter [Candidatus Hadarchaeota archaeon]